MFSVRSSYFGYSLYNTYKHFLSASSWGWDDSSYPIWLYSVSESRSQLIESTTFYVKLSFSISLFIFHSRNWLWFYDWWRTKKRKRRRFMQCYAHNQPIFAVRERRFFRWKKWSENQKLTRRSKTIDKLERRVCYGCDFPYSIHPFSVSHYSILYLSILHTILYK